MRNWRGNILNLFVWVQCVTFWTLWSASRVAEIDGGEFEIKTGKCNEKRGKYCFWSPPIDDAVKSLSHA